MAEHNLQFAALVGSRICHDLISPIGAITNGMELLSMSGEPQSPEMALISQSVDAANARIRFFRIAYGAPSDTQLLGRSEITSILNDTTQGSRLLLYWQPIEDVSRSEVQLVFLAIQCVEQALPYGGSVTIKRENGRWELEMIADRFAIDPALWGGFAQGEDTEAAQSDQQSVAPAHVQFLLLPMHAATQSRKVHYKQSENAISLFI